ncbi:MAG: site-specific integrase [Alphaproteobacteria bacterium]|nr:site-specific integrase [Alphaproteobacteria bacterium]
MPQHLTDVAIRKLVPAPGKRVEIWDNKIPGFGVRVTPNGVRSLVLMYRVDGHQRRLTLGQYPILPLAQAREKALASLQQAAAGIDPNPTKEDQARRDEARAVFRFEDVVASFVRLHCERHNRPVTARDTARILKNRFVSRWADRDVREITRPEIVRVLDAIVDEGTPSAANHALSAVRKFFNWCVERGLIEVSPCMGVRMPSKAISRSRVLDDNELAAVLRAADETEYPFGTIVRLLVLTGQRRSEVGSMRWQDLDLARGVWTIPPEANKSGREHAVPLIATAVDLIEAVPRLSQTHVFPSLRSPERCFSGYSKCKARLDADAGVTGWTLHDLRRTVATGLASLQVPPHVVEKLLNHTSGTFSGVAGVYNRFAYQNEMRAALEQWEQHLMTQIATTEVA